ncbi:Protein of unknown function [Pyronema omphalodes CBS 100304]|uniref:Uncharacterized protein n=1 Tax=Pyronema omphalodes (strain CBS 100304) TaxID=1076935 RepID=U4LC61_PYROM|nr:Protein of unknown function [Pyronema omphalodes CBS 100304]
MFHDTTFPADISNNSRATCGRKVVEFIKISPRKDGCIPQCKICHMTPSTSGQYARCKRCGNAFCSGCAQDTFDKVDAKKGCKYELKYERAQEDEHLQKDDRSGWRQWAIWRMFRSGRSRGE